MAVKAATVWLFRVVANVVRNVPKQAAAKVNSRPQSVVPYRSRSHDSSNRYAARGETVKVSTMMVTIRHGCSLSVHPVSRWISQYSPARMTVKSGGLLE